MCTDRRLQLGKLPSWRNLFAGSWNGARQWLGPWWSGLWDAAANGHAPTNEHAIGRLSAVPDGCDAASAAAPVPNESSSTGFGNRPRESLSRTWTIWTRTRSGPRTQPTAESVSEFTRSVRVGSWIVSVASGLRRSQSGSDSEFVGAACWRIWIQARPEPIWPGSARSWLLDSRRGVYRSAVTASTVSTTSTVTTNAVITISVATADRSTAQSSPTELRTVRFGIATTKRSTDSRIQWNAAGPRSTRQTRATRPVQIRPACISGIAAPAMSIGRQLTTVTFSITSRINTQTEPCTNRHRTI
jgi:hypothetical protein